MQRCIAPAGKKKTIEKKPYRRYELFFAPPPFTSRVICVVHKKRFEFLALGHLEPSVKIRETLPDSQGKYFSSGEKLCSPQRVVRAQEKKNEKRNKKVKERKKRSESTIISLKIYKSSPCFLSKPFIRNQIDLTPKLHNFWCNIKQAYIAVYYLFITNIRSKIDIVSCQLL